MFFLNEPAKMTGIARHLITALSVLFSCPASSQSDARAIGAVIAPPELIAEYTCITFAQTLARPRVKSYAEARLRSASDKPKALQDILNKYDSLLGAMCREVEAQFQRKRDEVSSAYAAQLPGSNADISKFLANSKAKRWAAENVSFLKATAPLIEYYQLAMEVAPELLDQSKPAPDSSTFLEINETSVGAAAQLERWLLIRLLNDKQFAKYAPTRLDLKSIAAAEERLRKESSTLRYATPFGWFNSNASDLIRREFTSFDTMRDMGLTEITSRHEVIFQRLEQEK